MSLDLDITGTVHSVGAIKQITDTFQKRDAIIQIDEVGNNGQTYTQHITLEIKQKACEYWDGISKGDRVSCKCRLRGRLYTRRDTGEEASFTSVDAWRVDVDAAWSVDADADPAAPGPMPEPPAQPVPPATREPGVLPPEDEDKTKEDIPF